MDYMKNPEEYWKENLSWAIKEKPELKNLLTELKLRNFYIGNVHLCLSHFRVCVNAQIAGRWKYALEIFAKNNDTYIVQDLISDKRLYEGSANEALDLSMKHLIETGIWINTTPPSG